jgi:thiol-disulfide isomerase/thioredoxin
MKVGAPARCLLFGALAVMAACGRSPAATQDAPTTPTSAASGAGFPIGTPPARPSGGKEASTGTASPATSAASANREGVRVVSASAESDALSLVRTERLRARAEGRVLVVYAGAAWCEPCKRFKEEIHSGRLDAQLPKVTLLAFDADRDTERLASAGYRFEYIPYVALPGADGRPTDTQEARGKGSGAWRELIAKLEAWQGKRP